MAMALGNVSRRSMRVLACLGSMLYGIVDMCRILYMSSLQKMGMDLRTLRLAKGLSQEALASTAGISRTTLIQIEKGSDAQVSGYESTARVLGVALGILAESPAMARRRQARADEQVKQSAAREKHLRIAVQFAMGGAPAAALKADALRMVKLWKDKQLCSAVYIERWQKILDAEPKQIAQRILGMDEEWGPALRQNTPFVVAAA